MRHSAACTPDINLPPSDRASGITLLSPLACEISPHLLSRLFRSNGRFSCLLFLFREPRHTPAVKSSLVPKYDLYTPPPPHTLVENPPVLEL